MVERERLIKLIDDLEAIKLVVVSAPAGYGKSTLMLDWVRRLEGRGIPTAWVTLDEHDDDRERALFCVKSAFLRAEGIADASGDSQDPRGPSLISLESVLSPGPSVVFVDDFEVIKKPETHVAVQKLIERLPAGKTLVVASRTVPELGLGQRRLRGELLEVKTGDLRFEPEEAGELLRTHHRVCLGDESIKTLCQRTEGWVAALRLTGLALEGRSDADAFVHALSQPQAEIAEYLAENVLAQQQEDVHQFLLETCVLKRLTGPLCDALTGRDDGFQMLDRLERSNLFLRALDQNRRWFRYHALFAGFLQARLERLHFRRASELHHAAARWLAKNGFGLDAVDHAFAAGDHELAAALLDDCAMESVRRGQCSPVTAWASRLPSALLDAHPRIRMAAARAHFFHRDSANARALVAAVERGHARRKLDVRVRDDLLTMQVGIAMIEDRTVDMTNLALENLHKLSCDGTFEHGSVSNIAGIGLMATGRFEEARPLFVQGRASHHRAGSRFGEAYSIALMVQVESVQGRLQEALSICRRLEDLEEDAYAIAVVGTPVADVLYELGELDEADRWIQRALPFAGEFTWIDASGTTHLTLARIRFAQGGIAEGIEAAETGEFEGLLRGFHRIVATFRWEKVRMLLRLGQLREAQELARQIDAEHQRVEQANIYHYASETEARDITALRLMIRAGEIKQAMPRINAEVARAAQHRRVWRWLKLMALRAQACDAQGDRRAALRVLREALKRAAPEGFVRSFADEGKPLTTLLQDLRVELAGFPPEEPDLLPPYIDRILAAAGEPIVKAAIVTPDSSTPEERLSEREIEVLALAAQGLSNRMLARRLFVSENTIKTHLRNIYTKLRVTSRSAAMAAGRRHRLIA
ncbi:MAG TPA: LuxR C-terminal-related transcriptional regulator [Candidatus Binataceae bacterium]|nr:LuxR C-terminal-related transcriptional regulator [Candidatus Binataceae bacterium]